MQWFRSYHGAPFDPKLAVVAKRAGVTRCNAVTVWWALLDTASQHEERGCIDKADPEELAVAFDLEQNEVEAIIQAMKDKGMIDPETERIAAWDKRQPKGTDDSTERVRRHRERQKAEQKTGGEEGQEGGETEGETEGVTVCNGSNAPEGIRGDVETPPCSPPTGDDKEAANPQQASKQSKKRSKDSEHPLFQRWYQTYPNKKAKQAAVRAFNKIDPDEDLVDRMIQAINDQQREANWKHQAGEFVAEWPHPGTWLNQRRWEDDVQPEPPSEVHSLRQDGGSRAARQAPLGQKWGGGNV